VELALGTLVERGDRFKCIGLLEDEYVAILASERAEAVPAELSIEQFMGARNMASAIIRSLLTRPALRRASL
jgi:hypothetical protein